MGLQIIPKALGEPLDSEVSVSTALDAESLQVTDELVSRIASELKEVSNLDRLTGPGGCDPHAMVTILEPREEANLVPTPGLVSKRTVELVAPAVAHFPKAAGPHAHRNRKISEIFGRRPLVRKANHAVDAIPVRNDDEVDNNLPVEVVPHVVADLKARVCPGCRGDIPLLYE